MSMLDTTPALGYTVAPVERSPLTRALWLTILTTALPALLYQNSGFLQFGYRFSIDYIIFFVMLLAVSGRKFTWLFKALVIFGIAVNLFGAITFDRFGGVFSYNDSFFPHGNN
jgi:glucan phosphoethanolaminetransferase (alkaline phosphatase superfamily)